MEETTFISISKTATADAPFRLTDAILPIVEGNIFCKTQDCNYGDGTTMDADIVAGDVVPVEKGHLEEIWFKNKVAGNNCLINFSGTIIKSFIQRGR